MEPSACNFLFWVSWGFCLELTARAEGMGLRVEVLAVHVEQSMKA